MNVYDLIESCHSMEQLDSIRTDVMSIIGSCDSVDEIKRIQDALRKQKNRVRYGRKGKRKRHIDLANETDAEVCRNKGRK